MGVVRGSIPRESIFLFLFLPGSCVFYAIIFMVAVLFGLPNVLLFYFECLFIVKVWIYIWLGYIYLTVVRRIGHRMDQVCNANNTCSDTYMTACVFKPQSTVLWMS